MPFLRNPSCTQLRKIIVTVLATCLAIAIYPGTTQGDEPVKNSDPERSIAEVLKDRTDWLLSLPGVVGTGVGECDGKPCIKILVERNTEELARTIPKTLGGFPVVTVETGKIRPLDQK
jgi:hypothetical protein